MNTLWPIVTLVALIFVVPMNASAIPCPKTLECPDGATFHTHDISRWCAKGDVPHGPQAICDRSGNLAVRDNHRDGVRHGRHQQFTSTGKLLIDENFVAGVVHGVARGWHKGGLQLASEIEMKHGVQHGLERQWHPNGVLAREARFVDGKQVGRTRTWHPSGARRLIANFKNGETHGERQQYHANNWIYELAHFDEGQLVGPYFRFSDTGKVEVKGQYERNLKVGEWLDDFGRGPAQGRYEDGMKVGEWRFFTRADHQLASIEHFDADLLHGPYERYEGGALVERGTHKHSLRDGVWETFENGKLQSRTTWDFGMVLEVCEHKGKRLKCVSRPPHRVAAVHCSTALPSSQFIDSQEQFDKAFQCASEPPIDWSRHRVYVHRDEVDPYALRFAHVEQAGDEFRLVFERHQVCYGMDPGPPQPRWITIVLPRDIKALGQRVVQIKSEHSCEGVP